MKDILCAAEWCFLLFSDKYSYWNTIPQWKHKVNHFFYWVGLKIRAFFPHENSVKNKKPIGNGL
jgi:hypothetical protein